MNAKLVWLLEKYNSRLQTHIGGSSSQTHELCDVYLTEKELHRLHLDEEVLRETLEEQAMDENEREEKIRQKQAEDEEFITRVEPSPLTPNPVRIIPGPAGIVQLSSSTRVEPSPSTPNPVRIIPGPAGIVQQAKLLKERDILLGWDGAVMSTQEYMKKVVEDVGDDEDFMSGPWVSATDYVHATGSIVTGCLGDIKNFLKNEKLEQVVAIVKSYSPNAIGDLTVTMKDLLGTIPGIIHHKVIGDGDYGKDITVGAVMILANLSLSALNLRDRDVLSKFEVVQTLLFRMYDVDTQFHGVEENDHDWTKLEIAEYYERNKAELEVMRKRINDQQDNLVGDAVQKHIQNIDAWNCATLFNMSYYLWLVKGMNSLLIFYLILDVAV
ncbi:transposase, MuDR, MULE transposase domain protein [Tanacetum coccineum]